MKSQWYCGVDGQQYGPYTWEQMRAMAAEGRLIAESYVRREIDQQWLTAAQIPGLLNKKSAAPPAPPTKSRTVTKKAAPAGAAPAATDVPATAPAAAVAAPPEPPQAPPLVQPPPAPELAAPAVKIATEPPAAGLPFNIQVQPPPAKSGAKPPAAASAKSAAAVAAAPAPSAPAKVTPAKRGGKVAMARPANQQAMLIGGLLASGAILLTVLAIGVFVWKSLPPSPTANKPAAKTAEQLAEEKLKAELEAIEDAKRKASVDAQLAAIDAANGKASAAPLPSQPISSAPPAPATPMPAATPPATAPATAANVPAAAAPANSATAAAPAPAAPAPDMAAAAKVIGTVKQWHDITRTQQIKVGTMRLDVTSAWLAIDATGKRLEAGGAAAGENAGTSGCEEPGGCEEPQAPSGAKFVFVQLQVMNVDTAPHSYASWNALAGTSAVLADADGQPLEFVPPTATPGVTRQQVVEVAPGQTLPDMLVFAAPPGPPSKLKLALATAALVGRTGPVKTTPQSHVGLEISPAYLLRAQDATPPGGELKVSPANAPAAGPPNAPGGAPSRDDFTRQLEQEEMAKKKEGKGGELEPIKPAPNLPRKP